MQSDLIGFFLDVFFRGKFLHQEGVHLLRKLAVGILLNGKTFLQKEIHDGRNPNVKLTCSFAKPDCCCAFTHRLWLRPFF